LYKETIVVIQLGEKKKFVEKKIKLKTRVPPIPLYFNQGL
jgi:hypothetical protein